MTDSLTSYFDQLLAAHVPRGPLAVACSGGADSLGLTLLAAAWAQAAGRPCTALIVDHGIRPESAAEARQVADWLSRRAIPSHLLTLSLKPGPSLQARARAARYATLLDGCRALGVNALLLGHHADDQAETVLLRLLAGSGPAGLAGMALKREQDGILLLRPLLGVRKTRLTDYLRAQGQAWIEDPSNAHRDFTRVRIRDLLARHPDATMRLWHIARACGAWRAHEERQQQDWIAQHVTLHPAGILRVAADAFAALPPAMQEALLTRMLMHVDGDRIIPRGEDMRRLLAHPGNAHTLHRCLLLRQGAEWVICREPAACAPAAAITGTMRWDRRFVIVPPEGGHNELMISALGPSGWQQIKDRVRTDLPYPARLSLPSLWQLEALASVPHIGYDENNAQLLPGILHAPAKPLEESPFCFIDRALDG